MLGKLWYNPHVDVRKLKRAWDVFDAVACTKREMNRANEELDKMKGAADYGLEISEKIGYVVGGTFTRGDLIDSLFMGVNMAPKINPKLWNRVPWRFKKPNQ